MGEQFTKDLHSRLEHKNFNDLLVDSEYIEELKRNPPELSETSLDNLAKIIKICKRNIPKPSEDLPASLRKLQQKDFKPSPNVITALHDFLRRDSTKFETPADHYAYTCNQESFQLVGEIIWRFLAALYYDLTSALDNTNQRTSTTIDGGVAFVAQIIKDSGCPDCLETIQSNVKNWVVIGRRFRGFANAIHSPKVSAGVFIYLHKGVSNNFIGRRLPMSGPTFDAAVGIFRRKGVHEKSEREGVDDLAGKITQMLLRPFKDFRSFESQIVPQESFQSLIIASTPSTTQIQQSPTLDHINNDPNRSYNIRSETTKNLVPLKAPPFRGSASNMIAQPLHHASNQGLQLHRPSQVLINRISGRLGNGDTEMRGEDERMLNHDQVRLNPSLREEVDIMDIDNTPSSTTIITPGRSEPEAVPNLAANGLSVSEKLFYHINAYFENSFKNVIIDDQGTLFTLNGAKLRNDLCNDFDSYCFTATMFAGKKLYAEFRHTLAKAYDLIGQILRAEHPRTLACFLEVFIHLIQTGLPEVTSSLRGFVQGMSANVIREGHPWGQICWLLGELDSESIDQAMANIWKCMTDVITKKLGNSNPLAIFIRLDYIKRVYGITNCSEEERLLRDLLDRFGNLSTPSTPRVMLNLAHNLNRQERHSEAEDTALEVLSLLRKYKIYAGRTVETIECHKIISRSQFDKGNTLAAEHNMRKAIQMIVDKWGIQHSWVLEFKTVLEGWLRGWGREGDANQLRKEIEQLMGRDGLQGFL